MKTVTLRLLLRPFLLSLAIGLLVLGANTLWAQAAPPAPAVSQAATATLANPYGLQAMWSSGGPVTRITLLILVVMSVGSWYVMLLKFAEQSRALAQARALPAAFWAMGNLQEGLERLPAGSLFNHVAQAGMRAKQEHEGALTRHVDLNSWIAGAIQNALDDAHERLQAGLALLATVASTSPFIGLFGTVWGIYQALTAIGVAGQASIDQVAGPVGEALIMTALGLAVAVPALLGYNWLGRRNRAVLNNARSFGAELHARLLGRAARAPQVP